MPKRIRGSLSWYYSIAEDLAERFRQGKLPGIVDGIPRAPGQKQRVGAVISVGFDKPTADAGYDIESAVRDLIHTGRFVFGVSGEAAGLGHAARSPYPRPATPHSPHAVADDVRSPTWEPGLQEAIEYLRGLDAPPNPRGYDKTNEVLAFCRCGEAKVLAKFFAKRQVTPHRFQPRGAVVSSFSVFSNSKLKWRDPCENCQTWVFRTFGVVLCHAQVRPDAD